MDGLVWFGVISTVIGAALFAYGMRHDPILAAAIPGGTGLLMVVLLYFILSAGSPSPVSQAEASDTEQSSDRLASNSNDKSTPEPVPPRNPNPGAANSQGTVDLLARIGPRPNSLTQPWSVQGGALISPEIRQFTPAKIWVPYRPPASFQMTAVVERLSGTDGISFGFPVGGRDIMIAIDGYGGNYSGINMIDRSTADRNESRRRGPFFQNGQTNTIVCTVGPDSVHVTVNGQVAVDWKGDTSRLSLDRRWPHGPPRHIHVSTWQTSFRISKLEVKPLP